jgi:dTDP-4-amino-4,6-dideoxygalactose transaminase
LDFGEKDCYMTLRTVARYGVRSVPGDEKEIIASFRRGEAVDGPAISEFENRFAQYLGMKHSVAASYGRMACHYILRSLELPEGSEIIFPALTFWVVPEIARRAGLRPVFVDVDPTTFNLDSSKIESAITNRTRVIVPTHLYGQPCDMNEIMRIAEKHDLMVVEDCAQAVGARYRGRLVGTFGNASFFSFQLLKGINTYGGGMAVTNDLSLAERIRELALLEDPQSTTDVARRFILGLAVRSLISPRGFTFWGYPLQAAASLLRDNDLSRFVWEKIRPLDPFPRSYRQRYSNAQAVIGLRALDQLDRFNAQSREHAFRYTSGLADCRNIQTPRLQPETEHVFYQYCVYTSNPNRVARMAARRGVDVETMHVDVCCNLPLFKEFAAHCPGAEATERALQLPVYSRLRPSDVDRVLSVVRRSMNELQLLDMQATAAQSGTVATPNEHPR